MTTLQTALTVATAATTSATLAAGKHTPVDATSGALTMTLPTPATIGARLRVEKADGSANTVTISGTIRGGASTIVLTSQFEAVELFAESLTSWRVAAGHKTKAALDAAYVSAGSAVQLATAGAGNPVPTGTTTVGTAAAAARADHVHRRPYGSAQSAGIAVGYWMFPPLLAGSTNSQYAVGQLRLVPVFVDATVTFDRIGLYSGTPGSVDSLIRFGVWAAKDGVGFATGAPLLDTGQVAGNVNDPQPTISLTLNPGKYWLGYVCNAATTAPTTFAANLQSIGLVPGMPGVIGSHIQSQSGLYVPGVTGALPDLTAQTYANTNCDGTTPFVALRVASYTVPA